MKKAAQQGFAEKLPGVLKRAVTYTIENFPGTSLSCHYLFSHLHGNTLVYKLDFALLVGCLHAHTGCSNW